MMIRIIKKKIESQPKLAINFQFLFDCQWTRNTPNKKKFESEIFHLQIYA